MADAIAESSPAQGETKSEGQQQDPEIKETSTEAENIEENSPDSKPQSESDKKDETVAPSDGDGKSEQTYDLSKIPNEQLGKEAQKRIKQLNAKYRAEQKAREAAEQSLKELPKEKKPQVELKEPESPKIDSFEKWEDYQEAQKKYLEERDKWVAEKTSREKEEADRVKRQKDEEKRFIAEVEKREAKTLERHPDFNRKEALTVVQPTDNMAWVFGNSEYGPDILWELQEDPENAEKVRNLPPWQQLKELMKMEETIESRIKGVKKPKSTPPKYVDDHGASPKEGTPVWEKLYK